MNKKIKILGKRKPSSGGLQATDNLLKLVIKLRGNKRFVPKGLQRLKTFKEKEECINKLENAAFNTGTHIDTILFVAAINIRDQVIEDLGFKNKDIDIHDPEKKKSEETPTQ